jgi:hypothetical protein
MREGDDGDGGGAPPFPVALGFRRRVDPPEEGDGGAVSSSMDHGRSRPADEAATFFFFSSARTLRFCDLVSDSSWLTRSSARRKSRS